MVRMCPHCGDIHNMADKGSFQVACFAGQVVRTANNFVASAGAR